MLRLGDIVYANCFPVHAEFVDRGAPAGVELVPGTPGELNGLLAAGLVDVAPASSIEYARHADRYRVLEGFAIGSAGEAWSILLETEVPLAGLDGETVALPTASATSVVLVRILLELRLGVRPSYRWFDQGREDPFAAGAVAALWIGDPALDRGELGARRVVDLGRAWTEWTGLPFVYALWQTCVGEGRDAELVALAERLRASRAYYLANAEVLARRHGARYGRRPEWLLRYWDSLRYELDDAALAGLRRFYALAAELGEAPGVTELRFVAGVGRGSAGWRPVRCGS